MNKIEWVENEFSNAIGGERILSNQIKVTIITLYPEVEPEKYKEFMDSYMSQELTKLGYVVKYELNQESGYSGIKAHFTFNK